MSNLPAISVFTDVSTLHFGEVVENILGSKLPDAKASIILSINKELDVEGQIICSGSVIEIELNPLRSTDIELTLGHELVHAIQVLEGRERLEEEAYEKEHKMAQEIKNLLAI